MTDTPLKLYNSLSRQVETFEPIRADDVRVYTCGPTVYNYQHIGNMRAFLFADTLGRVLRWKGFPTKHIINITDVGHLTSDADAGDDKMEKAAAAQAKSIWEIAAHYTEAFKQDVARLNITTNTEWTVATDHIPQMIDFAKKIEADCYEIEGGLYFDTSKVPNYGRLATDDEWINALRQFAYEMPSIRTGANPLTVLRARAESLIRILRDRLRSNAQQKYIRILEIWERLSGAEDDKFISLVDSALQDTKELLNNSRIDHVRGKRNEDDFAIWRKSLPGEKRQMEWDSPWGRGAPGWHLECSVMSLQHLGHPFDIHTGGIDHREIHHPNEIAQNQAYCDCADQSDFTGARIWMHNNFLVDRRGKMSKSSGDFLRLQTLIDAGFHPLAYRLMCLQAHYRSELEFSWENLAAANTRLKRLVGVLENRRLQVDEVVDDIRLPTTERSLAAMAYLDRFGEAIASDLNTPSALIILDQVVGTGSKSYEISWAERMALVKAFDAVLGLNLASVTRNDLRIRPANATLTETDIETQLAARKEARTAKDFARSDAIRDALTAAGVEVMDGDPLGWDWKISI